MTSKASYLKPPNRLKEKVGTGGLPMDVVHRAQRIIETYDVDYRPMAMAYIAALSQALEKADSARDGGEEDALIAAMIYPAMQLKATGGMFRYPLISRIADRMISFLETIEYPDGEVLEVVRGFRATMSAIIAEQISGNGGPHGQALYKALDDACTRYFNKYPENCGGSVTAEAIG